MANSKYEYVKSFERHDSLLPNTWIVVRLDGRGFHKFSERHKFEKPNDIRAIQLMNAAAIAVLRDVTEIVLAYGASDEFSFILERNCTLFERRESKIVSTIASTFTSYYTYLWSNFFPDTPLVLPLPSFDGRAVCYPTTRNLRDYLAWRQVDCHINNLYNTTFWTLVQKDGIGRREAEKSLMGTFSKDKHQILWERGINYNDEADIWKKGSVIFREFKAIQRGASTDVTTPAPPLLSDLTSQEVEEMEEDNDETQTPNPSQQKKKVKKMSARKLEKQHRRLMKASEIVVQHVDIIEDKFYKEHPYILDNFDE